MDEVFVNEEAKNEASFANTSSETKTSDFYKVDKNLPKRFNHPEGFKGYSKKTTNPLYQTTNETYGSKKPTVHEMPTSFSGSSRKFSEHHLKSGMYRDNGFNTSLDKSRLTGPNTTNVFHNRINFHYLYNTVGQSQ
nr:piercer of microtubule wall 1 protein [Misgurnus anguillicaudatus]